MKLLEISDYYYQYPDGRVVLNGLSLDLKPGEKVGLVGLNGSGKTTLLLSICGVLQGTGLIKIDGLNLERRNLVEIRKRTGMVFQDPNDQLFMLTVAEEVGFGPQNQGLSSFEVENRISAALQEVDVSHLRDRYTQRLSFGEKKRISIAAVIAMKPELLLLDEPTSNLDPKHRRQLIRILNDLPQAMLVATHDLDLVKELCSRVVLLEDGKITSYSPINDLVNEELLKRLGAIE